MSANNWLLGHWSFDYTQGNVDHTLFVRKNGNKMVVLIVYVDDMLITENDEVEIQFLKDRLSYEFEIKDLGHMKDFLGIEVAWSNGCIHLC